MSFNWHWNALGFSFDIIKWDRKLVLMCYFFCVVCLFACVLCVDMVELSSYGSCDGCDR